MTPFEMELLCTQAIRLECRRVTLTFDAQAVMTPDFPRGELLSVNAAGERNYAFAPHALLGWLLANDLLPPLATTETTS